MEMGIELIVAGLSALVGVVGGIAQANAASAAAGQEREARNIQTAQQKTAGIESRRQRIREERIRRAQIIAASENQGTSNSSGQVGAVGALSTNLSGLIGSSLGESKANQAVSDRLQNAADFTAQGNTMGAWTNTIQQGLGGFQSIFQK
jgi:hypothetical protein